MTDQEARLRRRNDLSTAAFIIRERGYTRAKRRADLAAFRKEQELRMKHIKHTTIASRRPHFKDVLLQVRGLVRISD